MELKYFLLLRVGFSSNKRRSKTLLDLPAAKTLSSISQGAPHDANNARNNQQAKVQHLLTFSRGSYLTCVIIKQIVATFSQHFRKGKRVEEE